MTTQNTHHDQSEIDASIVEHPVDSEMTVNSTVSEPSNAADESSAPASIEPTSSSSEVVPETPQEIVESISVEESASSLSASEQEVEEAASSTQLASSADPEITTTASSEENAPTSVEPAAAENIEEPTIESVEPQASSAESASEAQTFTPPSIEAASELPIEQQTLLPHSGVFSFSPAKEGTEEEIRPFTSFIEEFRQAEESQRASLQGTQAEAFTTLPTPNTDSADAPDDSATVVEATEIQQSATPVVEAGEQKEQQAISTKPESTTPELSTIASTFAEAFATSPVDPKETEPKGKERSVSPLLRPASRIRVPRHSSTRHTREEQQAPAPTEEPTIAESTAEAVVEQPPTRPARRYRFDRPATTSRAPISTPAPAQRTEELREKESTRSHNRQEPKENHEQPVEPATKTPSKEQSSPAAHVEPTARTQETAVQESTPVTAPIESSEQNHRRHSQERQPKEQPVAATVAPVEPEPVSLNAIAPEDLPPLEYSELQKATSRRRRRHRGSSVNGTANVEQPTIQPAQPVASPQPVSPPQPAAQQKPRVTEPESTDSSYTIVSGYTLSQMNQGNELSGPFMGPEPSPAKGSVLSRDGRNSRGELQRPPSFTSTTARTHEPGASAATINHFANVVSQAIQQSIQLQTDRMVAEMRRANQSPTSVSVSLPPFPSTERVGVFVDVANLLYSARTLRIAVDFGKLLDFLRGNRRLVRAHAYCPTSPQANDEQMFLQAVKGLGYRITTKNYKTFSSGAKKADLDLDLCMDVVRLVDGKAVDCIVLVSGDSDFMPMLDYCSDHGVRVEIAAFDEAMSATLRQSCDLFVNLSMLEEIRS